MRRSNPLISRRRLLRDEHPRNDMCKVDGGDILFRVYSEKRSADFSPQCKGRLKSAIQLLAWLCVRRKLREQELVLQCLDEIFKLGAIAIVTVKTPRGLQVALVYDQF